MFALADAHVVPKGAGEPRAFVTKKSKKSARRSDLEFSVATTPTRLRIIGGLHFGGTTPEGYPSRGRDRGVQRVEGDFEEIPPWKSEITRKLFQIIGKVIFRRRFRHQRMEALR